MATENFSTEHKENHYGRKASLHLRRNKRSVAIFLCIVASGLCSPASVLCQASHASAKPQGSPVLLRQYREGEVVGYTMRASNESPARTIRYEARARGVVERSAAGGFVEDLAWTQLSLNSQLFEISPASTQFREVLSLAPDFRLTVPDLSTVQPALIGPITDLLTFYADVQLAMRQESLVRVRDQVYVKHGSPNSWADGRRVILGQDAIDFDITLESIDKANGLAELIVRHVPPPELHVKLPTTWMAKPLVAAPNNWVQVEKDSSGKFIAGVGAETFEAHIKLELATGRIVSATLNNPVEVLERTCEDAELNKCDAETRYRIRRQISIEADPPSNLIAVPSH